MGDKCCLDARKVSLYELVGQERRPRNDLSIGSSGEVDRPGTRGRPELGQRYV